MRATFFGTCVYKHLNIYLNFPRVGFMNSSKVRSTRELIFDSIFLLNRFNQSLILSVLILLNS